MTKIKKESDMSKKLKELNKKIYSIMNDEKEINEKVNKKVKKSKNIKKVTIDEKNEKSSDKTYIIPLGGIEEVGKNMTAIQHRDEIIVIDAGLTFPEDEHLGIDLIIPSMEYLASNSEKIKALLITHGHEDHIGAVPYFYQKLGSNIPMYGGELSLALALSKSDRVKFKKPKSIYITGRKEIKIGKYFVVEFISVTHSIPDCYAIRIKTPTSTIFHTGDFKVDLTPIDGEGFDFGRIAAIGEEGVDLMLSDSTNAQIPGFTPSESTVGKSIDEEVRKATGRVILASFASHVHRLQQIVYIAEKYGRKIAVDGRSMIKIFDICSKLGYLKIPKNIIISLAKAESMPENEVMIICTGTQGEPLSVLSRIANGTHKSISLRPNDKVVISGAPIPGNEKAAYKNINQLLKKESNVVFEKGVGIHVSGHGCQEEQKLMLNLVKPKYFMPVHGEYVMLKKHKELAMQVGIKEENIILAENGLRLELTPNGFKVDGKVQSGSTYIYGDSVGNVKEQILKERQMLADDGVIIVTIIQDKQGRIIKGPEIVSRGFIYKKDENMEKILDNLKIIIKDKLNNLSENLEFDSEKIKTGVISVMNSYLNDKVGKVPTSIVTVLKI